MIIGVPRYDYEERHLWRSRVKRVLCAIVLIVLAISQTGADGCGVIVENPRATKFVLVVDKSGSMAVQPLLQAFQGVVGFVERMRDTDMGALISFEDEVKVLQELTTSKPALFRAAEKLPPSRGATRLHDAIGTAARLLAGESGQRAIIFLTDGDDNRSSFSLSDIRQITVGEGIFVYGVGVGNVDHDGFRKLTRATGGVYHVAEGIEQIRSIYADVQSAYYQRIDTESSGAISVTSRPWNRPVKIDGSVVGDTPITIYGYEPGRYTIEVEFQKGTWECVTEVRTSSTTSIIVRESEVPVDLFIETAPTRAAIFLDDTYVGFSSLTPVFGKSWDRQLRIPGVKPGKHTIRVVAAPDFDLGESFVFQFDFTMANDHRYVSVSVFFRTAEFLDGEVIGGRTMMPSF